MQRLSLLLIGLIAIACLPAQGQINIWTGNVDNDWHNDGNWDGPVPGDGDDVLIPVSLNNPVMPGGVYPSSGVFASFEVRSNVVVTCLGDTEAVNEASGGTTNVPHGMGVVINTQNALINGTMTADTHGFHYDANGFSGPGHSTLYGAGASHGGRGGEMTAARNYLSNVGTYGSYEQPTALGSAGYQDFGSGGGAIRINAAGGTLTVNGVITANGTGRGSGGSIWLSCSTFAGNGAITATGGVGADGANWGSAAGGRIALDYDSSVVNGEVSLDGGGSINNRRPGQPGSLWEPERFAAAPAAELTLSESYQYFFPATASDYTWELTLNNGADVYFHNFTNGFLNITNLLVTDGATLRFDVDKTGKPGESGNNRLVFSGTLDVEDESVLHGADVQGGDLTSIRVAGNSVCNFSLCTNVFPLLSSVTVTNAGSSLNFGTWMNLPSLTSISMDGDTVLWLPAGEYNLDGDLVIPELAVLYARGNTNAVNEDSGGATNVPHGIGLTINCRDALIEGEINANHMGFVVTGGYKGPGYSTAYGTGGGYGGQGRGHLADGANTYGSFTRPTALGSPGFTDGTAIASGGHGGGAIRIKASGSLILEGAVTASGRSTARSGGSGGSIWLTCATLQGSGEIRAEGGDGGTAPQWGNGGGGRIALEYQASAFDGIISAAPGSLHAPAATTGTVFRCVSPWPGTTTAESGRPWLDSQFSVNADNIMVTRVVNDWTRSFEWQDTSTKGDGVTLVENDTLYDFNGLTPHSSHYIYVDDVNLFGEDAVKSDAYGRLSFNVMLDDSRTMRVEPLPAGTILLIR